jgi:peptidoglycan/LPS O-acetylase OafA/YrhL
VTAPARIRTQPDTRSDIQVLRGVAVALVVLFHLWPLRLPGGYVGVDVFFVISGFLISAHLLREAERTGRISLPRFWARRARRLLPASLLVLGVTAVGVVAVLPRVLWEQALTELTAATVYGVNWVLAWSAVDYLAAENEPSPVQHFWSLSVEEQFYIVWPLLAVLALVLVRRRGGSIRTSVGLTIGVVTAASLLASVWWTASNPAAAYFVTPTRAWEFGLGALLAVVPFAVPGDRLRALASWAGLVAIGASAVLYDGDTPFPGYAALLPVVGAVVVLWAGDPEVRWAPMRLLRFTPLRFLGDISYSVYLWHWPLIVLVPYLTQRDLTTVDKLAILVATVLLGWLSLRYVENPIRFGTTASWRPARVLAASAAGMVVVTAVAGSAFLVVTLDQRDQAQAARIVEDADCYGAAALQEGPACDDSALEGVLTPTPLTAHDDRVSMCLVDNAVAELRVCDTGVPVERATRTVALIGDSHAGHWLPTLQVIAEERDWHVVTMLKGSCPYTDAVRATDEVNSASCVAWNDAVDAELAGRDDIDAVFVSASSVNKFVPDEGGDWVETGAEGYLSAWASVPASVSDIVVLRDIPRPRPDVLVCLDGLGSVEAQLESEDCGSPAEDAIKVDPQVPAAERAGDRVAIVDLNGSFCAAGFCNPVVGHAVVYRDGHHMTASFARSLAPYLDEAMPERLRG